MFVKTCTPQKVNSVYRSLFTSCELLSIFAADAQYQAQKANAPVRFQGCTPVLWAAIAEVNIIYLNHYYAYSHLAIAQWTQGMSYIETGG